MRRTFAIVLGSLLALSVLIAGVYKTNFWPSHDENGQASTTPSAAGRLSGVAIVDLDEVAKRLGANVALDKEINNGQTSLNQQLRTLQTSLQEQYRQKEQSLKSLPAAAGQSLDSQKEQLSQLERELNLKLNDAKRSAQNELINYRQRLIQRFRDEVTPVAQEVAGQRGLGVVLTKNDAILLTFDDAHDITAAVIAKMRAKRSASPAATDATTASAANVPAPPAPQRR